MPLTAPDTGKPGYISLTVVSDNGSSRACRSTTEIAVSPYTVPRTATELASPSGTDWFAAISTAIPVRRSPSRRTVMSPLPIQGTWGTRVSSSR